jgi:hypothetical protein
MLWIASGLLVIVALFFLIRYFGSVSAGQTRFNRTAWLRASASDRNSVRFQMVDDLGRRFLLKETEMSAVLNELGRPESVKPPQYFGSEALPSDIEVVWNYPIGCWSGWRVDMDYLAIGFSSQGRVVKYWVWQS